MRVGADDEGPQPWTRERRRTRLKLGAALTGVLGLALGIGVVAYSGLRETTAILTGAGWALLWIVPVHIVPVALDAFGWRLLLRAQPRAALSVLVWIAAVRDSINALLPVARIGGEIAGVRLLTMRGVEGTSAAASVIVEVTLTLVVQFLFTALGVGLLLYYLRDSAIARVVLLGMLASVPLIAAFFLLQHRWGLFQSMERVLIALTGRKVLSLAGDPARLDAAIKALYRQPILMAKVTFWQFAGLLAGAGELWLTLYLLGHPPSAGVAILLESLSQAAQSASFLVPAALGVQEGSFLLFGTAVGLTADVSVALSLARRVRQVGFGLPALLSWQWVEGRRLQRRLRREA